jgi:Protein of unknown function (DUF3667)
LYSNEKESRLVFFVLIFKQNLSLSHKALRKEDNCLNCGTTVPDRYCPHCGQENTEPHESFWHMVQHFLYDITHFDSKFFDSMKFLLLRPGFLPAEYIRGKRASYLNPIKKYVFTSAVFFIAFFSLFKAGDNLKMNVDQPLTKEDRSAYIKKGRAVIEKDSTNADWKAALLLLEDSSRVLTNKDMMPFWDDFNYVNLGKRSYKNRSEYDSVQQTLPSAKRDGWLLQKMQYRNQELKQKYKMDPRNGMNKMLETFLHKLPVLLFVSLPIFALLLKLLYIRRKKFYYADHGIFSIYHYIFSFFLFLLVFCLGEVSELTGWELFDWLALIFFLSGGVYLFMAMRRFYGQGFFKTLFKFILLNIGAILALVLLFFAFLIFSVYSI